ncbi:hypothetical protein FRB90_005474, partial [Tulasnella sp. 427]
MWKVVRTTFKKLGWSRERDVAVKILRHGNMNDKKKEFLREVEILSKLSHEHIISMIGFVEDFEQDKAWIVMPWEPNGNVREFLASGKWEIPERISLIQDMILGLKHLHSRRPPICHGDLKSLNILVNASYKAVITDFGSARLSKPAQSYASAKFMMPETSLVLVKDDTSLTAQVVRVVATGNQLTLTGPSWTLRWAAPELVREEDSQSLASDIWSAGWVCWEMMTDEVPFEEFNTEHAIMWRVVQGTVPSIHDNSQVGQVVRLCNLMSRCWSLEPENRPNVFQCWNEVNRLPSIPPLTGVSLGSGQSSTRLSLQVAEMHSSRGRQDLAASVLEAALACLDSNQDEAARVLEQLGDVYRAQCKFSDATNYYVQAQQIYACSGDHIGQANALLGLGHVCRLQNKNMDAEQLFTQAKDLFESLGQGQGTANTLKGLGDIYCADSRYEASEQSYTQALRIYNAIGDDQ